MLLLSLWRVTSAALFLASSMLMAVSSFAAWPRDADASGMHATAAALYAAAAISCVVRRLSSTRAPLGLALGAMLAQQLALVR